MSEARVPAAATRGCIDCPSSINHYMQEQHHHSGNSTDHLDTSGSTSTWFGGYFEQAGQPLQWRPEDVRDNVAATDAGEQVVSRLPGCQRPSHRQGEPLALNLSTGDTSASRRPRQVCPRWEQHTLGPRLRLTSLPPLLESATATTPLTTSTDSLSSPTPGAVRPHRGFGRPRRGRVRLRQGTPEPRPPASGVVRGVVLSVHVRQSRPHRNLVRLHRGRARLRWGRVRPCRDRVRPHQGRVRPRRGRIRSRQEPPEAPDAPSSSTGTPTSAAAPTTDSPRR
jgi:hypothetical protein